ncbi:TetR family transcriptional regulator [Paenibacillus alginolyticus]|uniref:TetR family transcriptional regulator n=1 Tax=Paenibacillus alginolyticus TaxID=59839 RepID=A0ABT4GES4_9BACL|nr:MULTISPECIES: TetR family transcriptional regulator [Paenibacillus]MCY9665885.1 TetR family transcriptional regulator [Paenibacillus alginolyticus]MCY9694687.1 TetR family transcriptional regulator [Paenibacillus alginolyticus]MEC0148027.1 TetR family transcriptional regulator [Paenibacillus alginolyticus]NRF93317.1 TetR family transcriptional regulator [Paenibacillus frigoriresistens]
MSNDLPLTKEAILDAAEQVLRRYGPDKTSVVDVARALQVSHGTLYRHFASKASLREAVTERWLHKIILDPLEAIAVQSGGSARERLRTWFETLIQTKKTYAINDSEMFAMYAAVTLDAVEMINTHVNQLIDQIARIIEEGMKSKEFRTTEPKVTARAIFIATSRFHHPAHAKEWSADTIEQDFASVWDLLLFGIS